MKLAIIGVRGIPVIYSGFETLAEMLSISLVKRGYLVSVYCRKRYVESDNDFYKGIRLIKLPAIELKNFETLSHSFLSTLHACFIDKPDEILFLGVGSAIFSLFPWLCGIKTFINVDGLDWKREKWGVAGRIFLKISEFLSVVFPTVTITDSVFIRDYYKNNYGKNTFLVPYGYSDSKHIFLKVLKKYNLTSKKYIVWAGRLVPDNHLDELIRAFSQVTTKLKCVVLGDDVWNTDYKKQIKEDAGKDDRIVFTGFINKKDYLGILANSFVYIETKRSGGTHPTLVDAMGLGCLIISNDHLANKQILQSGAFYYRKNSYKDLAKILKRILSKKLSNFVKNKKMVKSIAQEKYNWGKVVDTYQSIFETTKLL